jgi:hypothetical protein
VVADELQKPGNSREFWIAVTVPLFAAIAFYLSTRATLDDLDYTSRIASALLHGQLGLRDKPPDWLNEMIPWEGRYYSAFPLGAVLSMLPVALLQQVGLIRSFPGHVLAALIAGLCAYFFFQLANAFGADYSTLKSQTLARRIMLALFPIFGTWTWCNLGFGGAWQIALGLALLGQTAALYFTLTRPPAAPESTGGGSPFVAGAFFTLAFGNRTELLITLPIYLYLLWRPPSESVATWKDLKRGVRENSRMLVRFLSLPVTLALLTAAYNYTRFNSILDFGYMHIPEVRDEPWYQHGLFSIQAIPWNIYTMLLQGFESIDYFPYFQPNGFGCSIFLASPFLCLLFRQGGRYKVLAWVAIALLTLVLWLHGNPGSWQFSYRYAMILLPWMFLLLTGNSSANISAPEISLFALSVAINALAVWQFLWTDQIQP